MLIVPSQMTFTELHKAIAVAFEWNSEPCTSWLFTEVDQDPLTFTKRDDTEKSKPVPIAYCTAGYNMTPAHEGTQLAVGLHMKNAQIGKYWTYDYNIANKPHAIKIIDALDTDTASQLACLGGFGRIDRKEWQFPNIMDLDYTVAADVWTQPLDLAAINLSLGKIHENFKERKEIEGVPRCSSEG